MIYNRLTSLFYESHDTKSMAKALLGCELVHDSPDGLTSGIIIETEAYLQDDPACHAYNRYTPRTQPMYGDPGTIYVYHIYGMYQCLNVVSNRAGIGEAVLIRALKPIRGLELMHARRERAHSRANVSRKKMRTEDLCSGPGKLVQSMGISKALHNNGTFTEGDLFIIPAQISGFEIDVTTRIGLRVGTELPYRYIIREDALKM